MNTETLIQIIEMLDRRIEQKQLDYCDFELFLISRDEPAFIINQAKQNFRAGQKALKEFMEHLEIALNAEQNQVENALNAGE